MIPKLGGLWLQVNFRRLWAGQAASLLATHLTNVALPLVAVVALEATPVQMGVIVAMSGVPALAGLFLGVWVDRRARGPILVMADVIRAFLLLTVPIAYVFDSLTIEILYFVSFGMGAMSMLFEIAYRSFLPSVVRRSQLVEANSKLELANSGTVAVGPGIGGALIELVTAPFALLSGVVMFLGSAFMFRSLKVDESTVGGSPDNSDTRESVVSQIRSGFSYFRSNRILLGTALTNAMLNLTGTAYDTIYIIYLVRKLDFTPGMIGLVFSLGAIGLFGASFLSERLTARFGVGRTLLVGFGLMTIGGFLIPFAEGTKLVLFLLIASAEIIFILGVILWNIGNVSLRQAITPERLLGRVTAITIVMARAAVPIGALIGGFLGELIGLREAIFVFAGGMTGSVIFLLILGVWKVDQLPDEQDSDESVDADGITETTG